MRTLLLVMAGVLALSVAATASFIPGANNEVVNGEFEDGLLHWVYTEGEVAIQDYGHVGNSAQCDLNTVGWGDRLRQVIDDSTGNLWNPDWHAKTVDVEAWISIDVKHNQEGGVRFRLDWWDETYNTWNEAPTTTKPEDGYHTTDWVQYLRSEGYSWQFKYVNPFDRFELRDPTGKRVQPRWISVEIEFLQPDNVINRVDSVVLTSKCVPEPSVLVAMMSGLGGLGVLRVFKRK